MKSKLIKFPLFNDILNLKKVELKKQPVNKDIYITKEYNRIINSKSGLIDSNKDSKIAKGVIATINVKSDISMFNKQRVDLSVGLNYYDEVLEDALIGMKIGEKKIISINGKDVDIEVINIRNIVTCEITLDVLKEIDNSIDSKEDFESKLYDKYLNKFYQNLCFEVAMSSFDYAMQNSEFELDTEEVKSLKNKLIATSFGDINDESKKCRNQKKSFVRYLYKTKKLKFKDMTDKQCIEIIEEEMECRAKKFIFAKMYATKIGLTYTKEDYNKKVAKICSNSKKEEEVVRKNYTYDTFKDGAFVDIINKFAEVYYINFR